MTMASSSVMLLLSALVLVQSAPSVIEEYQCTTELTRHPNFDNCSKYYMCQNGKLYINTCPHGQRFHSLSMECVNSSRAICAHRPTTSEEELTTQAVPGRYMCRVQNGHFPHEDLCQSYYDCYNWLPYEKTCSPGTLFDQETRACTPETETDCGTRTRPDAASPVVTEMTTPVVSTTGQTNSPATTTTRQAFTSVETTTGRLTTISSPVETETTVLVTTTSKQPTTIHDGDFEEVECPRPDGYFPHPKDRQRFLVCVSNIPHLLKCPANLVFDPYIRVCVWPQ